MSLNGILRSRSDVNDWLKFYFPNPGLKIKKEILVPSKNAFSNSHNGEIGTSFDYLFRFNLERINKGKIIIKDEWVAEDAVNKMVSILSCRRGKHIKIGYLLDTEVNKNCFIKFLEEELNTSKIVYNSFLETGILSNELIRSTLFLARLDIYYRLGIIDAKLAGFNNIESDKILELEELFENVPWNEFRVKNRCVLNPQFGKGSSLVNGADADLLIDNSLIDLKVVKNLKLDRIHLNQIIGYLLLSKIGGVNGKKRDNISEIGIYFGRHGHLWKMAISDYYSQEKIGSLAKEFSLLIQERMPWIKKQINEYPPLIKYPPLNNPCRGGKIPLHVKVDFDFDR